MRDHLYIYECPYCGGHEIVYGETPPNHIDARCKDCGNYIKFVKAIDEKNWSELVKRRDGLICQICGKVLTKKTAHAHHLIPKNIAPQYSLDLTNGIVLCIDCHHRIHGTPGTITE
jgi:5-methylcytosine-specific restriction endonuclease McrA